jgi:hypothetical protein
MSLITALTRKAGWGVGTMSSLRGDMDEGDEFRQLFVGKQIQTSVHWLGFELDIFHQP